MATHVSSRPTGVTLVFQEFSDPRPTPGLSVVDALMHEGPDGVAELVGFGR